MLSKYRTEIRSILTGDCDTVENRFIEEKEKEIVGSVGDIQVESIYAND